MKEKILIVEDEKDIVKMLDYNLKKEGFRIFSAHDGEAAIDSANKEQPDLVILDLMLPGIDGLEVCKSLKNSNKTASIPIIMLTAKSQESDKIIGLELGADDYVTKPFNVEILIARINACLRKSAIHKAGEPELFNGNIRINLVGHQVFVDDILIPFTPKEYDLLRYFIVNRGKMLTHREILVEIWGAAHSEDKQYLRVFIGQIREKIEESPSSPKIIVT